MSRSLRAGARWAAVLAGAWAAFLVLGAVLDLFDLPVVVLIPLGVAGIFFVGWAQWLLFTRPLGGTAWWIAAYGAAWYLAWWLASKYGFLSPNILWLSGVGGGAVGVMQWITLRPHARRAWLWIPVSLATAFAGCWAGEFTGYFAYEEVDVTQPWAYVIGGVVCGLVMGFLSGGAYSRLTSKHHRKA